MGARSPQTEGRAVLTDIHSTSDSLRPAEALQGCCGGGGRGHLGTDLRQPGAQKVLGAGDCRLSSASCPQAAKYEDGVPANNAELAVRAKLVLPAGPGKLEEAQEGRWSPASGMFTCPQSLEQQAGLEVGQCVLAFTAHVLQELSPRAVEISLGTGVSGTRGLRGIE